MRTTLRWLCCFSISSALLITGCSEEDNSEQPSTTIADAQSFDVTNSDTSGAVTEDGTTSAGGDTTPTNTTQDTTPGDATVEDTTPGDASAEDTTPTDTTPGDASAEDTTPTDTTDDADTVTPGDPLVWPIIDGAYGGAPDVTFTLPVPANGNGIYYIDVQASFPAVDWQALDRLYIPAGHYPFIRINNLPDRDPANPLIITNLGGQVWVGALGHYYLFSLGGGSNWVLTGCYDPVSETGDAAYPGHRGGNFANTRGAYGILIDDDFVQDSISGLTVGGGATDFTVSCVEISEVGFAGMSMKTDNDGAAIMSRVKLHDNYIHDTGSEGLYIGSTQAQPQHQIRDWQIYNNRILRTGTEAIQLGQLGGVNEVHHNVFGPAAMDWRASFQDFQDNNFQIGVREGHTIVHHNIFIGAAGSMVSMFSSQVAGDSAANNVGVTFHDNGFLFMRNLGLYLNNTVLPGMSFTMEDNIMGGWRFERDEVYATATAYDHLLRFANTVSPVSLIGNTWSGPARISNALADNGTGANVTGSGNVNAAHPPLTFVDDGLPDGFDYLNMEMWTDVAIRGGDVPVSYDLGEVVLHLGLAYRCAVDPCAAGLVPPDNAATWTLIGELPDDVRAVPGSAWDGFGLTPPVAP
jgi:hypothetical protein